MSTTAITTQRVVDFAREHFFEDLTNLLDDPSWLYDDNQPAIDFIANFRAIASDLGLDLDTEIGKHGTAFERERLVKLLAGLAE